MTRTKSTVQIERSFSVAGIVYACAIEIWFTTDEWVERHEPFYHEPQSSVEYEFDYEPTPYPSQSIKRDLKAQIDEYISTNLEQLITKAN